MGRTIAEKILSSHAGRDLKAGDFAICRVDFAFGQDGTSNIIMDRIGELAVDKLKTKFCMVIDHSSPSPSEALGIFAKLLIDKGLSEKDIEIMGRDNPRKLIGFEKK